MTRNEGAAALVLAAGASRRLGRPKALLDFDGRTALDLVLDALRTARLERGVVVLGTGGAAIRDAVDTSPFLVAENPDPDAGRTGSIRVGLDRLAGAAEVLLWPVDRPLASAATVVALLGAVQGAADEAGEAIGLVLPETDGGRGHPFLLRGEALDRLRRADPGANPRELLRDVPRLEVAVDDPGIHFDLDTEDDYRRALAWWRARG